MIRDILLNSKSSSEALNLLYKTFKEENSKYSIGFLCKKSGIPSRGYLGEVLNGKRLIGIKYIESLIQSFGLKKIEQEILRSLIQIDYAQTKKEQSEYLDDLKNLKKIYKTEKIVYPSSSNSYLASITFASFGLPGAKKGQSIEDITKLFPNFSEEELIKSLGILIESNFIKLEARRYFLNNDHRVVSMQEAETKEAKREREHFFKSFIYLALENLNDLTLSQKDENYYESSVLSMNRSDLSALRSLLQENYDRCLSKFERTDGDCLVVTNTQCFYYPTYLFKSYNFEH